MGMVGYLRQINPFELKKLQLNPNPNAVEIFLQGERRIRVVDDDYDEGVDLNKLWHILHYLLTGSALGGGSPLANAILGGEEIGSDMGYGPARFLTPSQVREVADALSRVSNEELARRFDPEAMDAAEIYGAGRGADPELAEYALEYLPQLVSYYSDAAAKGYAMLLYIG